MGLNDRETEVVAKFLTKVLEASKGDKISKEKLKLILENQMLDMSLQNKRTVINLDE